MLFAIYESYAKLIEYLQDKLLSIWIRQQNNRRKALKDEEKM